MLIFGICGCSQVNQSSTSKLLIHFPNSASSSQVDKIVSQQLHSATLGFDWSLVCYVVNISGSDLESKAKTKCDIPIGILQGSVAPGGTLSVDVPVGKNRSVDVFTYSRLSASDPCPTLDSKSGFSSLARTRFVRVGQTNSVDMTSASVNVDVTVSTPADGVNIVNQYGLHDSCKPTNAPQGAQTNRISSSHTNISGGSGAARITLSGSVSGLQSETKLTGNGITIHLSRQSE